MFRTLAGGAFVYTADLVFVMLAAARGRRSDAVLKTAIAHALHVSFAALVKYEGIAVELSAVRSRAMEVAKRMGMSRAQAAGSIRAREDLRGAAGGGALRTTKVNDGCPADYRDWLREPLFHGAMIHAAAVLEVALGQGWIPDHIVYAINSEENVDDPYVRAAGLLRSDICEGLSSGEVSELVELLDHRNEDVRHILRRAYRRHPRIGGSLL